MASGWNLWVSLQCIGVVSGCCCKEVYAMLLYTNKAGIDDIDVHELQCK